MSSYQPRVSVFVTRPNGAAPRKVDEVERNKLTRASTLANDQLRNSSKPEVIYKHEDVDSASVDRVIAWIKSIDFSRDVENQSLTASFAGNNPSFEAVVKLHSTGYYMRVPAKLRGQPLESFIWEYMHQTTLSKAEFQLLWEWIPFSKQVKAAIDGLVYQKVHGPVPPEMEEIEEYCRQQGLYDQVEECERRLLEIKEKKEKKAAEEAERRRKAAEYAASRQGQGSGSAN